MGPFTDPEGSYYTRSASKLISKMRHVAAYLLAALSGSKPTADAVNNILASVGVEADPEALKIVTQKFEGKDIGSLIASGGALLASMPAGGGGGAGGGGAGGAADAPAAEEKKEEKQEEPEEESDDDMGFGLFD